MFNFLALEIEILFKTGKVNQKMEFVVILSVVIPCVEMVCRLRRRNSEVGNW